MVFVFLVITLWALGSILNINVMRTTTIDPVDVQNVLIYTIRFNIHYHQV